MPRERFGRAVTNHWFSVFRTMVVCTGRLPGWQMHRRVFHLLKCHRSVNRGFTGASEKQMVGWFKMLPTGSPSAVELLSTDVNTYASQYNHWGGQLLLHVGSFWFLQSDHLYHGLYILKQDKLRFPGMCVGKYLGSGPKSLGISYSCIGFHLNLTHAVVNNKVGWEGVSINYFSIWSFKKYLYIYVQ